MDELHDEVRAAAAERGRIPAARLLRRRVPVLALGEALAYVSGLSGGGAPEEPVEVVTRELVAPADPVMAVDTFRVG
ncbi:hypothetical protein GT030_28710 [Streptomyces sp. SID1328]|uniref:hypothetical protein n=1 Tax=Streptomyces sp. SID1328 TaxID=2690250 RepID=UPI0013694645|nr:hypothetical protein [Streptomyces sp. SID1328]MYV42738.1 hypothetical protein [Streptomyces sp. SID1328]